MARLTEEEHRFRARMQNVALKLIEIDKTDPEIIAQQVRAEFSEEEDTPELRKTIRWLVVEMREASKALDDLMI
jgi:hypothetical protein